MDSFGSVREPEQREILEAGAVIVEWLNVGVVPNRFYNPEKPDEGTPEQWQIDLAVCPSETAPASETKLRIWAPFRNYISSRTKMGEILEAFLGRALVPEEDVRPDHVKGKRAQAIVTVGRKQDGTEYNKITQVLPLRKGTAPARATSDGLQVENPLPGMYEIRVADGETSRAASDEPASDADVELASEATMRIAAATTALDVNRAKIDFWGKCKHPELRALVEDAYKARMQELKS
jgi:hypothetical protein